MNLSQNRFTLATLVVMLGVTVALVAVGFTVNVEPAYAGTCGPNYVYTSTCQVFCYDWGICEGGATKIHCSRERYQQLSNPWSRRYDGTASPADYCFGVNPDCQTYCSG